MNFFWPVPMLSTHSIVWFLNRTFASSIRTRVGLLHPRPASMQRTSEPRFPIDMCLKKVGAAVVARVACHILQAGLLVGAIYVRRSVGWPILFAETAHTNLYIC